MTESKHTGHGPGRAMPQLVELLLKIASEREHLTDQLVAAVELGDHEETRRLATKLRRHESMAQDCAEVSR